MRRAMGWRVMAVLTAAAMFSHAHAALFDDDEARKRIAETNVRLGQIQKQLEDRLAALEQQLRSGGLIDLANQVDAGKGELAKLRGQIEVLTYELAEAQKRQKDLYVDLDSRMRKLETAQAAAAQSAASAAAQQQAAAPPAGAPSDPALATPPAVVGALPPPTTAQPPGQAAGARPSDPAAEQRAYDAALDLFKRGDYNGAIAGFGNFVRTYPRTALAPSAQYWIGNAHYAKRDYRAAITAQRTLIANYPDSNKVPDALLNIGSAQGELGESALARRTLEDLVRSYPASEAAAKAKQRLAGR